MSTIHFIGPALPKMVSALSPFYTVALVYLLPLVMTASGRRFRDAAMWSWMFVICIMCVERYLLPIVLAQLEGRSDSAKIPDPMPGLGVIVLFGWIPGVLMASIGRFARWCSSRWKHRTAPTQAP